MLSPPPAAAHGAKHITCYQKHSSASIRITREHTHTYIPTRTLTSCPAEISEDRFDRSSDDNHDNGTRAYTKHTLTITLSDTGVRTHGDTHRSADCSRQSSSSSSSGDADPLSSHLPLALLSSASLSSCYLSFAHSLSFSSYLTHTHTACWQEASTRVRPSCGP